MEDLTKQVKKLKYARLLAIPVGALMFFCTKNFVGNNLAIILGFVFGAVFFFILEKGRLRVVGEVLIDEIRKAIDEVRHRENIIEIKKTPVGMITRVYIINAQDDLSLYKVAIANKVRVKDLEKYLAVLQFSNISNTDEYPIAKKQLELELENLIENHGDK